MSGILAVFGKGADKQDDWCRSAINKISYRGKNSIGVYKWEDCCIGINHMAIQADKKSKQPISNKENTRFIAFDGCITNAQEMKKRYLKEDYIKANTDAEIILHLWEKKGKDFLIDLEGTFAFFIFDKKNKTFFAARDHFGVKPLFFVKKGGLTYFASEVKALLDVDTNSIEPLQPGHFVTPEENSEYYKLNWKEIHEIDQSFRRYYIYPPEMVQFLSEEINEQLTQIVRSSIPPGVKIASSLSGGLDSSILTHLALKWAGKDRIILCTVGTEDSEDIKNAKLLVEQKLLTDIHIVNIFTIEDVIKIARDVIWHIESFDPIMCQDSIPTYIAAKMAAESGCKIFVDGDGSDEIMGSYDPIKYLPYKEMTEEMYFYVTTLHKFDLRRVDHICAAFALEPIFPYLNRNFVEFMFYEVPPDLKVSEKEGERLAKFILRKAFESELPPEIVWRPKQSFFIGSGINKILRQFVDSKISYAEFKEKRKRYEEWDITSKDELFYFETWKELFPNFPHSTYKKILGTKKYRQP